MANLQVGDSIKTAEVARAEVGQDGAFTLRVDPSVSLDQFTSATGIVNFDLWGETSNGMAAYSFSRRRQPETSLGWFDPESPSPTDPTTGAVNVELRPSGRSQTAQEIAPIPVAASDKTCLAYVAATYDQRQDVVGERSPRTRHRPSRFRTDSTSALPSVSISPPGPASAPPRRSCTRSRAPGTSAVATARGRTQRGLSDSRPWPF